MSLDNPLANISIGKNEDLNEELEINKLENNLERFVKTYRDILILSMLENYSLCGYDIIKHFYAKYNILLSQTTIYATLYCLEREGIIRSEYRRGNMRTKYYALTPEGRVITRRIIDNLLATLEFLISELR